MHNSELEEHGMYAVHQNGLQREQLITITLTQSEVTAVVEMTPHPSLLLAETIRPAHEEADSAYLA